MTNILPQTTNLEINNPIDNSININPLINVTNRVADSCNLNLPNYEDVRDKNIKTINDYYDDLLTQYTKNYSDYSRNSSGNASDRSYAETQLKPKTTSLNNQIIKLNQQMIDSINIDNDAIITLKNQLEDKKQRINDNIVLINKLKENKLIIENQYNLRNDNLKSSINELYYSNIWSWFFLIINIILIIIILISIGYLIFSNNNYKNNVNRVNINPGVSSKKINV